MLSEKYYIKLFLFGAIWNFVICLSLLLAIALQLEVWDLFGLDKPNSMVWLQGFLIFVGCFGIGYFAVSKNLKDNHAAILLGIVAKMAVFFLMLYYLIIKEVGVMVFLLGVGDLIWALLFIEFLLHYK